MVKKKKKPKFQFWNVSLILDLPLLLYVISDNVRLNFRARIQENKKRNGHWCWHSRFRIDTLHRGHVVGRYISLFAGWHSAHCSGIPPLPGAFVQGFQCVPGVKAQVLLGTSRVIVQGHIEAPGRGRRRYRLYEPRVRLRDCPGVCQNAGPLLFVVPGLSGLFKTCQERVPACGKSLLDLHLLDHSRTLRVGQRDGNVSSRPRNIYKYECGHSDTSA